MTPENKAADLTKCLMTDAALINLFGALSNETLDRIQYVLRLRLERMEQ